MNENKLENKEILKIWEKGKESFSPGHRTCAGCFIPTIVRTVLGNVPKDYEAVTGVATGCAEVTSTLWPHTSWNTGNIHSAFENVSTTISGAESAYQVMKKQGTINKNVKFIAFGGDGGTVDIGLAALSGTLERGHDMLYVLYDNECYANTGIQRSGSTPIYANTTTSPSGSSIPGKQEYKKDIMKIVAGHNIPYLAQANPFYLEDFVYKIKKAFSIKGPKFLDVLMPCTLSWKFPNNMTPEICRLATETNIWPLYEIENGKYNLNYEPKEKLAVEEFLKHQGRFKHIINPKNQNALDNIQKNVDFNFNYIKKISEFSKNL